VALTQGARVDVTVGGRPVAEVASSAPDPSGVTPIAIGAGSIVLLIVATVWMRRGATRKAVQ
jgi:hypothetical protein